MTTDWQPMFTAPMNAKEVRVRMKDLTEHPRAHFADLSGSDQPPFKGWFIPVGDSFHQIDTPLHWKPIEEKA